MKKYIAATLLTALLVPVAYYGTGYVAASRNAKICEEIAFREAIATNISGFDMRRTKVSVQRSQVSSTVSPYQVEVTYSVPRDLHATIFLKKFSITALGEIRPGDLQKIYLM